MISWDKYFDKIYCIHLIEYKERFNEIKNELERVGIDTKSDYFSWKYTTRNKMYQYIYNNPNFPQLNVNYITDAIKNCTMAHYEIMCECKAFGYERVLILEDDIRFLKNVDEIETILNNLPNKDIVLLDKWTFNKDMYRDLITNHKINDYYAEYDHDFTSCACYSLTAKGIDAIMFIQEHRFLPADFCVNNHFGDLGITRCMAIKNIGIQKQFKTDKIDIEYNINAYKDIVDMNEYNKG